MVRSTESGLHVLTGLGRVTLVLTALLISTGMNVMAQERDSSGWEAFAFLIGDWVAEGGGSPGQATGTFSHSYDLQKTVIVRRNHAEYPATGDRPAFTHDDLMVIYHGQGGSVQAQYFDNEGHVIHYSVDVAGRGDSLVFTSDLSPSSPRFRFTYLKQENDALKTEFAIAQPGSPANFRRYVEGFARRKK